MASAHGAARLITDALATLRRATVTPGTVIVRADSAYFTHQVVAAIRRGGASFSVTARMNPAVAKAIATIDEQAWTTIRYPQAIWDEDQQVWISDAEIAEVRFTAFTSRRTSERITARLIVRCVKRLNNKATTQGELVPGYRYHAVFTDSTFGLVQAEATHRDHAVIESVFADLKHGPLAHVPSGVFTANAACLALAGIAFNLTRAAARLTSTTLGKARTATVRRTLITVAGRAANQAHHWRHGVSVHSASTPTAQDRGMHVQLLYFDECPNWQVADARLREALETLGRPIEVEKVLVNTPEQAEHWRFHGSPSVLIDGEDPFARPGTPVGLSCRLYRTPQGVGGSPTVDQLIEVLSRT